MSFDSVLMIGFGGPTPGCCGRRADCPCPREGASADGAEARCFVAGILGDNPARAARVEQIVAHYRTLGGFSPYNDLTAQQAQALAAELERRGRPLPVYTCFRHWSPWPQTVLRTMKEAGCERTLLLILSPHQSSVSWDWYIKYVAEAVFELGAAAPRLVGVAEPWWRDPGFITGLAARIAAVRAEWSQARFDQAGLIFTAHAIPQALEATSPYRQQVEESAGLVAEAVGRVTYTVAFQSQPDTPGTPWSEPTIAAAVRAYAAQGCRDVIVQAVGFLVDHVEVLYDLDHETRALCEELGLAYHRAPCVHDHPAFIEALADRVLAAPVQP